jgi:glycosyltransferase involved in cell wall biosynthesis
MIVRAMGRPAKVTMLLDSLNAGGAERIAVEVACALDRTRFAPSFVVFRHTGALERTLLDGDVPYTILGRSGRLMPRHVLRRAQGLVAEADLVLANKLEGSLWGTLLARRTGVPLVTNDQMWTGRTSRRRTLFYRRWIGPTAKAITAPSSLVADSIVGEGVEPSKVFVVRNGVHLDRALTRAEARRELGLAHDEFVVGIIARLREQKRHDVLLRAAARLVTAGRRLTVCIVGTGEQEASLRALSSTLGLEDTVLWSGERQDAGRLGAAFDIGVLCSWWEGLPLAGLEMMAAGTPLVSTPVGAMPEVMEDGAGVFVAVGDVEGLASAIAELMDDPNRRASLAQRGLARVRERYSFETMVDGFVRVFDTVLADASARGAV